jgi:tetratricopeptide (TPR) repeat protein
LRDPGPGAKDALKDYQKAIETGTDRLHRLIYLYEGGQTAIECKEFQRVSEWAKELDGQRPIDAALLRGGALRAQGKTADAIGIYDEALRRPELNEQVVGHAQLLIARGLCRMLDQNLWDADSQRQPPQCLADMREAARLDTNDNDLKAMALAQAAKIDFWLISPTAQKPEDRQHFEAMVRQFREATSLAPHHPELYDWQFTFASALYKWMQRVRGSVAEYRGEALKMANQSLKSTSDPAEIDNVKKLIKVIQKL